MKSSSHPAPTKRVVSITRFARAPFSATVDSVVDYFTFNPQVGVSPVAFPDLEVVVEHTIVHDVTDTVRKHDALLLRWDAPSRLFPSLEALLTVRPHAPGTMVRLTAHYTPPFALAGQVFDAVIGRHIASLTLRRVLAPMLREVEDQHTRRESRKLST